MRLGSSLLAKPRSPEFRVWGTSVLSHRFRLTAVRLHPLCDIAAIERAARLAGDQPALAMKMTEFGHAAYARNSDSLHCDVAHGCKALAGQLGDRVGGLCVDELRRIKGSG